jgi:hypothetical protein
MMIIMNTGITAQISGITPPTVTITPIVIITPTVTMTTAGTTDKK